MPAQRTAPHIKKPVSRPAAPTPAPPLARAVTGVPFGGQALDRKTERQMSARFGHDFSRVRIHSDAQAAASAEALGANAYAWGGDIVFGGGKYQPGSQETERLLAHELTHVAQQERFGPGDWSRTSDRADVSEREADRLASQVMVGRSVDVRSAPGAWLARDEADPSTRVSTLEDPSSQVSTLADPGPDVSAPVSAPNPVDPWAGAAQTPARAAASRPYVVEGNVMDGSPFHSVGGPFTNAYSLDDARATAKTVQGVEADEEDAVDWKIRMAHSATSWAADKARGIPVLEQLTDFGKLSADTTAEVLGGAELEATEAVGGLAGAVADSYDAARGLLNTVEHAPIAPGVFNIPKDIHGLVNMALGDETGKQFQDSLDPVSAEKENLTFNAGQQFASCQKDVAQGNYARCAGRLGFDIGSAFLPGGGAASKEGVVTGNELKAGETVKPPPVGGDPWADAGAGMEPPGGGRLSGGATEPPSGGGDGGGPVGGGRNPPNIVEMIEEELLRGQHDGARPLREEGFKGPGDGPPAMKPWQENPEKYLQIKAQEQFRELDRQANLGKKVEPGALSRNERGPVFTEVLDPQDPTGQVHFGLNDPKHLPPAELENVLQERYNTQEKLYQQEMVKIQDAQKTGQPLTKKQQRILTAGPPGYHSEVYALNDALKARRLRTGQPVTAEELNQFMLENVALKGEYEGGVVPRCYNCDPLTEGVTVTTPLEDSEDAFHDRH